MKKLLLSLALLSAGALVASPALAQGAPAQASSAPQTSGAKVYPSGYTFTQMLDALGALRGVQLRSVAFDDRGYLNLIVASDADRERALSQVAAAGLPVGLLAFDGQPYAGGSPAAQPAPAAPAQAAPATAAGSTLPASSPLLAAAHSAVLSGPQTVTPGTPQVWSFNLINQGTTPIVLEHGACDVRFEVVGAGGEVIRPNPRDTLCTLQLVITEAAPGQTAEVQKIRWEGKDAQGQPVPAGVYTIRSAFQGGGVRIVAEPFTVTVR